MGDHLLRAVVDNHAAGLPGNELKALLCMARVAFDQPGNYGGRAIPAGTFFGGWERIAEALGRSPPPAGDDSPDAQAERGRCKVAALAALKGLKRRGLVSTDVGHAHSGTRQVYRLNLRPHGGHKPTAAAHS